MKKSESREVVGISSAMLTELDERGIGFSEAKEGGRRIYALQFSSPAGQDVNIDLDVEDVAETPQKADKLMVEALGRVSDDYDPSQEAYYWLGSDGHGKNGAPDTMGEVYDDFVAVRTRLASLYADLNDWVSKRPEPVDVSTLVDLPYAKFKDFKSGVSALERPYIYITPEEYQTIMENGVGDVVVAPDGRQFSYGNCDGGHFALMPLAKACYFPVRGVRVNKRKAR